MLCARPACARLAISFTPWFPGVIRGAPASDGDLHLLAITKFANLEESPRPPSAGRYPWRGAGVPPTFTVGCVVHGRRRRRCVSTSQVLIRIHRRAGKARLVRKRFITSGPVRNSDPSRILTVSSIRKSVRESIWSDEFRPTAIQLGIIPEPIRA
jgi:hypothetical protein